MKSSDGFGRGCLINGRNQVIVSIYQAGVPLQPSIRLEFWNSGTITPLGWFDLQPTRLLNDDEFLDSVNQRQYRVRVKHHKVLRMSLPRIEPEAGFEPQVEFDDMNSKGTLVGAHWGGTGPRTAFRMDRFGRTTDLSRFTDREASYTARLINESGAIVVTVNLGQAFGGGLVVEMWKNGGVQAPHVAPIIGRF